MCIVSFGEGGAPPRRVTDATARDATSHRRPGVTSWAPAHSFTPANNRRGSKPSPAYWIPFPANPQPCGTPSTRRQEAAGPVARLLVLSDLSLVAPLAET